MRSSKSIQLSLRGNVAEHVDELLLASVIELAPETPQIFFDLAALSIETSPII